MSEREQKCRKHTHTQTHSLWICVGSIFLACFSDLRVLVWFIFEPMWIRGPQVTRTLSYQFIQQAKIRLQASNCVTVNDTHSSINSSISHCRTHSWAYLHRSKRSHIESNTNSTLLMSWQRIFCRTVVLDWFTVTSVHLINWHLSAWAKYNTKTGKTYFHYSSRRNTGVDHRICFVKAKLFIFYVLVFIV